MRKIPTIGSFIHTHTHTPTTSELQGALEENHYFTHSNTIYSCLPPAYTPSDVTQSLRAWLQLLPSNFVHTSILIQSSHR